MTTPVTAVPESVKPLPPFDDPQADTILRSADGADFHVSRAILSLASPFFKDMFSIPQPVDEADLPVIPVVETGDVLNSILRVWYPGATPVVGYDRLQDLCEIIELLLSKYDIQFTAPTLQTHLQIHMEKDPLTVFVVSCRYGWAKIAKAAARSCLKLPIRSLYIRNDIPQLIHISVHHYRTLLAYHDACAIAASEAGTLLPWSKAEWVWIRCTSCTAYSLEYAVPGLPNRKTPRAWIFDYVDRAETLLKTQPRANLLDLTFLAPTVSKAASCAGFCRTSGYEDLAKFIVETFVPAVNAAIDRVQLKLDL
ncbi:hypothetical protein C8R43DRAFT_353671 [Mycena crocata]|nr:hypothetical protein C8R43DRAFT_353671 [Mycena crocata]